MSSMITRNEINLHSHWQWELGQAFTSPEALLDFVELKHDAFQRGFAARQLFPMRVPKPYAARIKKSDAHDPLLRQVLPLADEFSLEAGYSTDPLEEQDNQTPGLLHKYTSRVLLIFRGGCAINCRYCFRRHFPYQEHHFNQQRQDEVLHYLKQHPEVNEVILSGGDPLMAKDTAIACLLDALEALPQIKRLRIHSRLLITLPSRITATLVERFARSRLAIIVVTHINHAQEIDAAVITSLMPLRTTKNISLLNQSVLLRGVNDNSDCLCDLSEKLFDAGILPYYLHQLDKVQGAAHFAISDTRACELMRDLLARLPGFLVPKLTREIAGQTSKTPIDLGVI